jgi:hypothetical protein
MIYVEHFNEIIFFSEFVQIIYKTATFSVLQIKAKQEQEQETRSM